MEYVIYEFKLLNSMFSLKKVRRWLVRKYYKYIGILMIFYESMLSGNSIICPFSHDIHVVKFLEISAIFD